MTYGTLAIDTIQSSTTGTPTQFQDGSGTQIGTLCRAWVNYKGSSTQSIRASFNVSSVTYNGTGDYTINFTNALTDANYSACFGADIGASDSAGYTNTVNINTMTSSALRIRSQYSNYTAWDAVFVCAAVFR